MFENPVSRNNDIPRPFKENLDKVSEAYSPESVHAKDEAQLEEKKRRSGQREQKEEAADHFTELSRAAETAHVSLMASKSPYRFCVYQKEAEVYIDIVLLDESGRIARTVKKNITHEEFRKILEDIAGGEGLFFDARA
jgi:hypothetical protein